jgi:hypothetical protein
MRFLHGSICFLLKIPQRKIFLLKIPPMDFAAEFHLLGILIKILRSKNDFEQLQISLFTIYIIKTFVLKTVKP